MHIEVDWYPRMHSPRSPEIALSQPANSLFIPVHNIVALYGHHKIGPIGSMHTRETYGDIIGYPEL